MSSRLVSSRLNAIDASQIEACHHIAHATIVVHATRPVPHITAIATRRVHGCRSATDAFFALLVHRHARLVHRLVRLALARHPLPRPLRSRASSIALAIARRISSASIVSISQSSTHDATNARASLLALSSLTKQNPSSSSKSSSSSLVTATVASFIATPSIRVDSASIDARDASIARARTRRGVPSRRPFGETRTVVFVTHKKS